jgi:hypothetical protein
VAGSGGTGGAWEYVYVDHVSGSPCGLDGQLTLSIEQDGRPLALVANNPASIHLLGPMGFGERLLFTWPEGGCTDPLTKHLTYVVRFGSRSASRNGELNCGNDAPSGPRLSTARGVDLQAYTGKGAYERALAKTSN